jgi:hypothetical protein
MKKCDRLWQELLNLGRPFSKVDIREVGRRIYYLSDERIVRIWVNKGYVRDLNEMEKRARNLSTKIAWYEIPKEIC